MTIYDISTQNSFIFCVCIVYSPVRPLVLYSKNFLLSNGNKNFSNSSIIIDLLYSLCEDIRELFGRWRKLEYIFGGCLRATRVCIYQALCISLYSYTTTLNASNFRIIYSGCIMFSFFNNIVGNTQQSNHCPDNYCSIFAIHII